MKRERVKTTVRIDKELMLAARHRGLDEGKTLRRVLEESLRMYLSENGRSEKKKRGGRLPLNADADPRNADWIKSVGRIKGKGGAEFTEANRKKGGRQ